MTLLRLTRGPDAVLNRKPARRRLALATLCLAVLIAPLDTAVVNLALNPNGRYFGADVSALRWTVDGYNLDYALLLLTGGLIADLLGPRRVFIMGAASFGLAPLVCATALDISLLIGARVLAGIGAALLLPASLATLRGGTTRPGRTRPRARHLGGLQRACQRPGWLGGSSGHTGLTLAARSHAAAAASIIERILAGGGNLAVGRFQTGADVAAMCLAGAQFGDVALAERADRTHPGRGCGQRYRRGESGKSKQRKHFHDM